MMTKLHVEIWLAWKSHETGATASEYSLLLLLITVAIVVAVKNFGDSLPGIFRGLADEVDEAVTTSTIAP